MNKKIWKLNTSNAGKFEEFKKLFANYDLKLESSHFDLDEIIADPMQVVVQKASQLEESMIVDDTSLDIEGASLGIQIKWLLDHLDQYEGKKATWTVLLAFHQKESVFVYKGQVHGIIVKPQGSEGFGFDPVFLPKGSTKTLAESKPDHVNARAIAVKNLIKNQTEGVYPVIKTWDGPWQNR